MSLDHLLTRFRQWKTETLDLMKEDPVAAAKSIEREKECVARMGLEEERSVLSRIKKKPSLEGINRRLFRCRNCEDMLSLIDFYAVDVRNPFKITFGSEDGTQVYFHIEDHFPVSEVVFKKISYPMDVSICDLVEEKKFIGIDSFTQRVLAGLLFESDPAMQPHLPFFYAIFSCGNNGYILYRHENTVPTIPVWDAMVQLFSFLKAGEKYNFVHENPLRAFIRFVPESVSYFHDGIHVHSNFTLQIGGLGHFTFTVAGHRIHTYSQFEINPEDNIARERYQVDFDWEKMEAKIDSYTVYKVPMRRGYGAPFFRSSYTGYAFLIELLREDIFRQSFFEHPVLAEIWEDIWENGEVNFSKDHPLEDKYLRCDMIDHVWSKLKMEILRGK